MSTCTVWGSVKTKVPRSWHDFLVSTRCLAENDNQTISNSAKQSYLYWSIWKQMPKWFTYLLEIFSLLFRMVAIAVRPLSYDWLQTRFSTLCLTQTIHYIADKCIFFERQNKRLNSVFQVSDLWQTTFKNVFSLKLVLRLKFTFQIIFFVKYVSSEI